MHALLAAVGSDSEDTVWVIVLVFAILGAGAAVWSFVKKRPQVLEKEDDFPYYPPSGEPGQRKLSWQPKAQMTISAGHSFFKTAPKAEHSRRQPIVASAVVVEPKVASRNNADLKSGIELLERAFLLNLVSDTESDDDTDITMRKICFQELMRRGQLGHIDSGTLTAYSLNKNNLYGKEIQRAALQELALRTGRKAGQSQTDNTSENAKVTA